MCVSEVRQPRIYTLMGPTASGKTDLAIALHKEIGCELVSVDSTLVYRQMDIGTAKPTADELAQAPHHLIDIRDPSEAYSAAEFVSDARTLLTEIEARGNTALFVGGTMLYFKALLEGLSPMPSSDLRIRQKIEALASADGWPAVHNALQKVDPAMAEKIHPNHSQRLSRALEVCWSTGKKMSDLQAHESAGLLQSHECVQLALIPQDRKVLHSRIQERFERMLDQGFVEEVRNLFQRGDLNKALPAIRAVGYRQVWEFLEGNSDCYTMKEKGVAATRQLAKRQLTWLRGWDDLNTINTLDDKGQQRPVTQLLSSALEVIN